MTLIPCAWSLVTAAATPLVDLAAAKLQLSLDDGLTAEDSAIERRVSAATADAEGYLHRGLLTQTWKYAQDIWSDEIALPMAAPLQSVTHVKYYDADGALQTLDASEYLVDTLSEPGRVLRAPTGVWPALQANRRLAVEITYVVGWESADDVPADIVEGVLLLLGTRQEHRESVVVGTIASVLPHGAESLLAKHRVWWRESHGE